jgi:hypothetical protein
MRSIRRKDRASKVSRIPSPTTDPIDYNRERPVFSFIHLSRKYCVSKCTTEQKAAFADKMRTLSELTWNDILITNRRGNGFEGLSQDGIKDNPPPSVRGDVKLIGTKFHDYRRIVGFREDATFHIIWFDYDGSLYDHD